MNDKNDINVQEKASKLSSLIAGPMRYGDPDDKTLRKTEKDIIISKMIREEATKKCSKTLKNLLDCARQEGLLVTFKCKPEKLAHNDCLIQWASNPEFVKEITDKYLEARSHFRRTGKPLEKYDRFKKSKVE